MSCYHPIYAYKTGRKTANGKDELKFCASDKRSLVLCEGYDDLKKFYGDALVPLPCGHCLGCSLDKSKDWAVRCVLESSDHEANCFLTLTYDEAHCPNKLDKKEVSSFLKRLRARHPGLELKFFSCGEYGSLNGRPHYHLILFGYDFPDKELFCHDGVSHIFRSKELESLWTFGISSIGDVTLESCAYVARYSLKKQENARGDEFLLMSRRPGIAANWALSRLEMIYLTDHVYGSFGSSHVARPPRYFDKLAEKEGIDLTVIKEHRIKRANELSELGTYLHGMSRTEDLRHLHEIITAGRIVSLRRYV